MLRVIDSLSSLYQDWSQLRAQGSVKNSSVALSDFCVSVCAESCDWLSPGLLGAAQQVWADMCQGGCFPAVQQGRRRRTSRRRHARIRNRPPPVGGKDTNNALRCPGAWGAFFAATELLQAAGQCHEQAASSCVRPQEQQNYVLTCAIDLPINLAGTYRNIRLGIAKYRLTIRAVIKAEINLMEPRRCKHGKTSSVAPCQCTPRLPTRRQS